MPAPIRAACYYRRSDPNKQEDSIERQHEQVVPYCQQKGYVVVQAESDDLAGDEFERRPGLQKILAGARAGNFAVIVTDEWSRLSRQEPIDFIAKVVKPLKDAGVTLDCVLEGPQKWDDLAQLVMLMVRSEKSRDESVKRA